MSNPDFVYTTYIQTTPEKLWAAITNPEFSRQYWASGIESDWKKGSAWRHLSDDKQTVRVGGDVLESDPPHRLVMTWAEPADPIDISTVTFAIEAHESMVRLTVTHGGFIADSKMVTKISGGWPRVLSSLKSMLETGKALDTWAGQGSSCGKAA